MNKWDKRFLQLAKHVSTWSKDPSTQVGAVIVRPNKTVASLGYNGLPRGIPDTPSLLADREYKYDHTVHAEMNAILNCSERPEGHTLYVWPMGPCVRCAPHIVQAGISVIVAPSMEDSQEFQHRWKSSCYKAKDMLTLAGVNYREIHS